MKKTMVALVAGIMFAALALTGCSVQEKQLSNVQKITYISRGLDTGILIMDVLTPDCIVKEYEMGFDDFHDYDLFAGELPPDIGYRMTEYKISKKDWNDLINTINENNFAGLPEELPHEEAMDGAYIDIQVETADGAYKSGGYMAGHWDDRENKRFGAVSKKIYEILENAQELPYRQYQ